MKKISNKKLAIALLELLDGKTKKEAEDIIGKFFVFLKQKNKLSSIPKIEKELEILFNKQHKIVNAHIETAEKIDEHTRKEIEEFIKNKTDAQTIELTEKINTKLLGGIIMKYEDKIIDSSIRTKLNNLKIEIEK